MEAPKKLDCDINELMKEEILFNRFVSTELLLGCESFAFTIRMREACFSKCIARFAEADLSPGESVCIDRYILSSPFVCISWSHLKMCREIFNSI
jgi:hypothetical protein